MDYITDDAEAKTTFEWRKIDDLEIFGANSQSVILVVRGYELVVATHWESVRNAMLMCEKFSPFEEFWAHYGLPGTGGWGWLGIANIAISPCQQLTDMST